MTPQRDPEAIARELDEHRTELARSLDELTERVSPKRLVDTARDQLLHTTKGRAILAGAGGLVSVLVAVKVTSSVRARRHRHPLSPHRH